MNEYVIPQEFNQSDRIGKYTMPQAMILGFGLVVAMLLLASGFLPYFISIPIALVVLVLTFIFMNKKINSIPLYEFILVWSVFLTSPKLIIYKLDNNKDSFRGDEEDEEFAKSIFVEDEESERLDEPAKGKKSAKTTQKKRQPMTERQRKNVKKKVTTKKQPKAKK